MFFIQAILSFWAAYFMILIGFGILMMPFGVIRAIFRDPFD